jgi:glycine/D-amino acid oxidase-like deaminating enzyme
MNKAVSLKPYWWEDAPPKSNPHTYINPQSDVVIVGAGYTGLSAALTLAEAGKSVQVFDRDLAGAAASSRNGGITSGSLRPSFSDATRQYGEQNACRLFLEAKQARLAFAGAYH